MAECCITFPSKTWTDLQPYQLGRLKTARKSSTQVQFVESMNLLGFLSFLQKHGRFRTPAKSESPISWWAVITGKLYLLTFLRTPAHAKTNYSWSAESQWSKRSSGDPLLPVSAGNAHHCHYLAITLIFCLFPCYTPRPYSSMVVSHARKKKLYYLKMNDSTHQGCGLQVKSA